MRRERLQDEVHGVAANSICAPFPIFDGIDVQARLSGELGLREIGQDTGGPKMAAILYRSYEFVPSA